MKSAGLFIAGLAVGLAAGWMAFRTAAPAPVPARPPAVTPPVADPPATAVTPPPQDKPATARPQTKTAGTAVAATPSTTTTVIDPNPKLETALVEARLRISELEAKVEAQSGEQAKLAAMEGDLRAQVARVTAEADQLRRDLQQRTQRIGELEAARQRAAQESAAGLKNAGRLRELAAEMDELNRRREAYLNNVLTRYREATDLLRTMSMRLDNPRDAATPLNNDLSRIQQAVQHADEDLRQLRSLNARAAQMQKELAQASAR